MLQINHATQADISLIRELALQVWPQTYASIITPEQIEYMMKWMYAEQALEEQMREGSQFIIVWNEKETVGFGAYQQLEPLLFKLHKIYVLPSQQGKGTGKFIIDYVINIIKKNGGQTLQLQVNKNNSAKIFYEKLGFYIAKEIKIDIGNGFVMDDYLMEIKL